MKKPKPNARGALRQIYVRQSDYDQFCRLKARDLRTRDSDQFAALVRDAMAADEKRVRNGAN